MKRNILVMAAVLASSLSFAQSDTLRAVVNIKSDYTPVTMPVKKINFTPDAVEYEKRRTPQIQFSESAVPYSDFVSERSTKELTHTEKRPYNGYVRAGYGVVNELDAKAAYNIDITSRDNINAMVSVDGYNRYLDGEFNDWKSRLYNTVFDASYSHRFNSMMLGVDAGLDNMVFNYQDQDARVNMEHTDRQNSMNYRVSVKGASLLDGPFSYSFRAGYTHGARKYSSDVKRNINENRIFAEGTLLYNLDNPDLDNMGVDIDVNAFIYNGALRNKVNRYNDYASINIAPYLNFNIYDWGLRLGTNMNFVTANTAVFSIAPDIRLRKNFSDKVLFHASITGGRQDNYFSKLQSLTPYWGYDDNVGKQLKPTYRIVDLLVGSTFVVEPLLVEMSLGYAYTKDDLLQTMDVTPNAYIYSNFVQRNTHNAHAFARVGYDLGGWLKVSGDARYDFWHCSNKDLLVLKPEVTCNVNAQVRVWGNLTMNAGYNFTYYTRSEKGKRVSAKNELNFRMAYQFTPRFGAYLQGDNLLNDSYYEYAGYYTRGVRGLLGLTANF